MSRRALLAAGAGALAAVPLVARAREKLRISLETNPNHVRNRNTERFVAELRQRSGGRIEAEIFPSA